MTIKILTTQLLLLSLVWLTGCEIMPVVRYKPTLHNPFPELTNVAVVPFYNETGNNKVDGREFALYYANELQRIPGFRIISNELVEKTMLENGLHRFEEVEDIRYLATLLNVDVVVIGKIHDFSGYYPPRMKLETEWYAKNPYLHPIPIGYGEPWGTEFEGYIPQKVVLLAEKELATAQIQTQTPDYEPARSPEERRQEAAKQRRQQTMERKPRQTEVKEERFDDGTQRHRDGRQGDGRPAPQQAKQDNPIRLATAIVSKNQESFELGDDGALSRYAEEKQARFVNRNLELTGVPYVPEAVPPSREEQQKSLMEYDPLLPHPLSHGPWPSRERKQAGQNPWSDRGQGLQFQQGMMNPGTYQGHYVGQPAAPLTETGLTPEQLAHYAQFGWIHQSVQPTPDYYATMPGMAVEGQPGMIYGEPDRFPGLPADWPDPRGFIPESPGAERPQRKVKSDAPVLTHINLFKGNDSEFMQALDDYDFLFRDDKRLAGKQSILNNRSEFIEFCCRMHIWEMLGARGGAGPSEKVVREWKLWEGGQRPY